MVQSVDEDGAADPWRRRSRRTVRQMPLWQELPLLLIVAFCLAVLIRTFLLQAFFIPSGSMEDTLLIGDRVLVNKVVYDVREPRRGEVVVFRGTDRWAPQVETSPEPGFLGKLGQTLGDLVGVSRPGEKDFIKRVIGVAGDRVACCDAQGRVTVNGVALDESYVLRDSPLELPPNGAECRSRRFDEVVVPSGQLFVLGDHRLVSQDARCQGPVPVDNVIGRAFLVVWPSARWTSLPVPETFGQLDPTSAAPAPLRPVGGTLPPLLPLAPPAITGWLLARSGRSMRVGRRRLHL
ncbi:signal peptidase I [Micromonospora sp. WMMD882]|uniref:signal peptidase I n=1 Tax=Micromonospora sp. WMMD882 TaxID=3015151 RepID=UPI00248CC3AB|nr:signal peptidase I [Micromonospora sp. WMMD882]WBB81941.1 signal peptidase I [Micromonospora sp. WMMD882]